MLPLNDQFAAKFLLQLRLYQMHSSVTFCLLILVLKMLMTSVITLGLHKELGARNVFQARRNKSFSIFDHRQIQIDNLLVAREFPGLNLRRLHLICVQQLQKFLPFTCHFGVMNDHLSLSQLALILLH